MLKEENTASGVRLCDWPFEIAMLEIYLLDGFELFRDDEPLPLPATFKARSLLAYLVTYRDRACPREGLADLFWPGRPGDKALRSLSTALWQIRRVLPSEKYLISDAQSVRFNPESDYWLDVAAIEQLLNWEQGKLPEWVEAPLDPSLEPVDLPLGLLSLRQAVALYRGDFLEGFYDDWCLEERYRLEGLYLGALQHLVTAHEMLGRSQDALHYAELLLARNALLEDVHCTVVRLHVQLGNPSEAIRQAQWCRSVLRSELGADLRPETALLYDKMLGPVWRREPVEIARQPTGPPPQSRLALIIESPPFVGRETEWQVLLDHWEQASSGQGGLVFVGGEAGVGKTRLVEELGQHVQQLGHRVVRGRCYEYECTLPHGLLADVLRAGLSAAGEAVLERLPDWQIAELVRLAPELVERFPSLPVLSLSADQQQERLFEALTLFLLDLAQETPLLFVLEDLHWVGNSALAWLHYLARRLKQTSVLLLSTYRFEATDPTSPLSGLVLDLEREKRAVRLDLDGLSQETLSRWMVGADDSLVSRVHRQTEGNPLFVLETLRSLFEEEKVRLVEGQWVEVPDLASLPVPISVRQVVERRVGRLSPQAREMASIAAVIGRAFDFDVLQKVLGRGEGEALEALDELLRYHLIREGEAPSGGDYEFGHNLTREAIYLDLHYRRRRRFHRLVAEAMEYLCVRRPGKAGEIAYHFERAGEIERALTWMVEAGEQARQNYRPREALAHFQQAAALLDADRSDTEAGRALTGLAMAHRDVIGEGEQVWRSLERALAIWEALDNRAGVAKVCYALAYRHADFGQARAWVMRGIQAVEGRDGLETTLAQGYGLLARFYEHEGNFADARIWSREQQVLSERIGDQSGLAQAHHRLGSLLLRMGGPMGKAVAHEREAAHLAENLGWLDFAAGSYNIAGHCLLAMGCTVEAEQSCRLALRLSTELNIPWRQCWAWHYLAEIASLRGEWKEAGRFLDRAEETMVHSSTRFQEIVLLRARGQLAARQGDAEVARPLLETALEISQDFYPRYVPELELELAALSLDEGDTQDTRRLLEGVRERLQQSGMEDTLAKADRLRGRLAVTGGDLPAAEDAFASSLQRFETLQQVVEAARTRLVWGDALLSLNRSRSRELLESALSALEAAEAWPEVESVRRLLA
jgi:DNA-binding SARP family transcriptional activator/tetratricopeptide (TPR) repeat protein